MIKSRLGISAWEEINDKNIRLSDSGDQLFWTGTYSGLFSFCSAWEMVRRKKLGTFLSKNIWHPTLPLKISVFMWKLMHKGIAVDLLVQRKGVSLVSKCNCCCNVSDMESINHLFLQGDITKLMWKYFAGIMGTNMQFINLDQTLITWWSNDTNKSLSG